MKLFRRSILLCFAASLGAHLLLLVALIWDKPQVFLNRSPVRVRVVEKSKRSSAASAPQSKPKPPKKKPAPTPTPSKPEPQPEPKENVAALHDDIPNEGADQGAQDIIAGVGEAVTRAHDAALLRSTFRQPEYTRAALLAQYEDEVIADILVDANGTVESVKFRSPVKHGMETRLIQSIQRSRFQPAQNENGEKVAGWTQIRFKLVIPQ